MSEYGDISDTDLFELLEQVITPPTSAQKCKRQRDTTPETPTKKPRQRAPRAPRPPRAPRSRKPGEWDEDLSDTENVQKMRNHRLANLRRRQKAEPAPQPFWKRGPTWHDRGAAQRAAPTWGKVHELTDAFRAYCDKNPDQSEEVEWKLDELERVDPVYLDVDDREEYYRQLQNAKDGIRGKKRERYVVPVPKVDDYVETGPTTFQSVGGQMERTERMRRAGRELTPEWLEVAARDRHKYRRTFNFGGVDVALKEDTLRQFENDFSADEYDDADEVLLDLVRKKEERIDMAELFKFAL